ncbi:hypothetical protein ACFO1V_03060 [Daeguia caeni]|uniref:Uncharacterized protein n=1 Tax=Daeguia caeni TaxID=439612 RepID=A0ABV9H4E2_9HYPH
MITSQVRIKSVPADISALVDDYIARNGVRKFAPNDGVDIYRLAAFLADYGYEVDCRRGRTMRIRLGKGKPKIVHIKRVIQIADEIRIAQGLEPFDVARRQQQLSKCSYRRGAAKLAA